MSEAKIRDQLATNLSVFGMGLKLIRTEFYLPNINGTRGFVDILASDTEGRFVIIELKRSNSSAREAIHEILKYAEGLKKNKSLKDSEIRTIIVSTEWTELLIPFSALKSTSDIDLLGFSISVDDNFIPISISAVLPVTYRNERMLSDLHMCYTYYSNTNLQKGIESVIHCYESKRVMDYIIVILEHSELDKRSLYKNVSREHESNVEVINRNKLPPRFMIYTTSQCLSDEDYLQSINANKNDFEDFDENELTRLKGIEKTNYLYGLVVLDSQPWPYKDHAEVGTPAKFSSDILGGGWHVKKIIKGGILSQNELLEDNIILDELKGFDGKNHQIYKKSFISLRDLKQSFKEVKRCLLYNTVWSTGIGKAFEDIDERLNDRNDFTAEIYIFNPSNTISTLNSFIQSAMSGDDTEQWMPRYYIDVISEGVLYKYYGCLVENEDNIQNDTLSDVFEMFYAGKVSYYFLNHISGGFESRDCSMVTTYGMKYANFLCIYDEHSNSREPLYYDGFNYIASNAVHPYQGVYNFIEKKSDFCKEIIQLYDTHVSDVFFRV